MRKEAEIAGLTDHGRCTPSRVPTAEKKHRFPSNQPKGDPSTAEIASRSTDPREGADTELEGNGRMHESDMYSRESFSM